MNDLLFLLENYSELWISTVFTYILFNDCFNLPDTAAAASSGCCKFLNFGSCERTCPQLLFYLKRRNMITKADQSLSVHSNLIVR